MIQSRKDKDAASFFNAVNAGSGYADIGKASSDLDVCLYTDLRFARNIDGEAFVWRAGESARLLLRDRIAIALKNIDSEYLLIPYEEIDNKRAALLSERYPGELSAPDRVGGAFSASKGIRLFINDIDHIRLSCRRRGFHAQAAYAAAFELETALDKQLGWACDTRRGFLGPSPEELGARISLGFSLFLPGVEASGILDRVFSDLLQAGFTIAPLFVHDEGNETDDFWCPYYRLEATSVLGEEEKAFLDRTAKIIRELVEGERLTRTKLIESRPLLWTDRFNRALAIANNAYLLTEAEAVSILADLRFAAALHRLSTKIANKRNEALVSLDNTIWLVLPAALRFIMNELSEKSLTSIGFPLSNSYHKIKAGTEAEGADAFRAALVREALTHYHIDRGLSETL